MGKSTELIKPNQTTLDMIAWAVTRASQYFPGANTCLVQALAAQILLSRRGIPARLRLGVFKDDGDDLKAHAWVETNGIIVIGGEEIEQYTPLTSSEEKE